jgi:hypothetical protein
MKLFTKQRIIIGLVLAAILGGAFFLRFNNLGQQSYWMDEGYTVNAVISGLQNGTKNWSEMLDSGRTYFCPIYCYPTKLIVSFLQKQKAVQSNDLISEPSPAALGATPFRFLSALSGLLTVLLFFWFAKKTFKNNSVALLATFFTAFSYWQIAWSRQARWYTLYDLFFWLALLFTYLATTVSSPSPKYGGGPTSCRTPTEHRRCPNGRVRAVTLPLIILALSSAILATLTHSLGYGIFAVIAVYLFLFSKANYPPPSMGEVRRHVGLRQNIGGARMGRRGLSVLLLAGVIMTMLILESLTGFQFSRALISKISFHYELPYYLSFYLRNYWLLILLSLYGFFAAPREHKKIYWLIFLPILGYLVALSFLTNIVHYRYLFAPISGLFLTAAAGTVALATSFQTGLTAFLASFRARKVDPSRARNLKDSKETLRSLGAPRDDGSANISSPSPNLGEGGVRYIPLVLRATCYVLLAAIFLLTGEGIIIPKHFYFLESDPASAARPSWVYTPQPNFNKAYEYIKNNLKPGDVVISSHPQFTKIFLNQPGYWIKYDYLGLDNIASTIKNNKEYYVGAQTINNVGELSALMLSRHGYIVYDYMSADNRIPQDILDYIGTNASQVFSDKINTYSQIWVYKF